MADKYPGFSQNPYENWFPYPEELSEWWYRLTGSEQKVLDYILRHTLGFQKTSDAISYRQFIKGVRNCDNGCGIRSTRTLSNAIKGLINKGYITKTGGKTSGKPTRYCLVYKTEEKNNAGLLKLKSRSVKSKKVRSLETKDTIDNNTIEDYQYIYTEKDKKITKNFPSKYSSINEITEKDLVEIAEKYQVSLGFVKLKLETLKNYCEAQGRGYKNYKSALCNFVLKDMQRQIERSANDKYKAIDARHIK